LSIVTHLDCFQEGDIVLQSEDNESAQCPYCASENDCQHLLLCVDKTFRTASGGELYDAFKQTWASITDAREEDPNFDEAAEFDSLLDGVDYLADHSCEFEIDGGPGVSSAYVAFYVRTIPKLRSACRKFGLRHKSTSRVACADEAIVDQEEVVTSPNEEDWLSLILDRCVAEHWCVDTSCGTCGSYQMRAVLLGNDVPSRPAFFSLHELSIERAADVIAALRVLGSDASAARYNGPVKWLLFTIWSIFHDRADEELFPHLDGTWAGSVLGSMRNHYAHRQAARQRHEARQGVKQRDWEGGGT